MAEDALTRLVLEIKTGLALDLAGLNLENPRGSLRYARMVLIENLVSIQRALEEDGDGTDQK